MADQLCIRNSPDQTVIQVSSKYDSYIFFLFSQKILKDFFIYFTVHQRRSHVAEDHGAEEIHLNGTDAKSLIPGSSASNKLSRFFDKVIEKHFYARNRDKSGSGTFNHAERIERRRLV